MLKFAGDGKNGRVFFLGLSRASINRLTHGQPIKINLADMGGPKVDLCILFGETERLLFNSLKASGYIPEDVELHEARPDMVEVVRIKREESKE